MLVAFLPDSELPGLSCRERKAARKEWRDHLQTCGWPKVCVLNAAGRHYVTHQDHRPPRYVDLPRYTFTAQGPSPAFVCCTAILLGALVYAALILMLFGDLWKPSQFTLSEGALVGLACVGVAASHWKRRR